MYRVTIKTKYNVITLEVEDVNEPNLQEVLDQPYILEVRVDRIKELTLEK